MTNQAVTAHQWLIENRSLDDEHFRQDYPNWGSPKLGYFKTQICTNNSLKFPDGSSLRALSNGWSLSCTDPDRFEVVAPDDPRSNHQFLEDVDLKTFDIFNKISKFIGLIGIREYEDIKLIKTLAKAEISYQTIENSKGGIKAVTYLKNGEFRYVDYGYKQGADYTVECLLYFDRIQTTEQLETANSIRKSLFDPHSLINYNHYEHWLDRNSSELPDSLQKLVGLVGTIP
jgi:hypothetical protein